MQVTIETEAQHTRTSSLKTFLFQPFYQHNLYSNLGQMVMT